MQKEDHPRTDPCVIPEEIQRLVEDLNESEYHIVDCIFEDWKDFYRIIMNIEDALSREIIQETDIQNLYQVIHKIVASRNSPELERPPCLARAFFELPEIIHKHLTKHKIF
jgi:hypothetical protein